MRMTTGRRKNLARSRATVRFEPHRRGRHFSKPLALTGIERVVTRQDNPCLGKRVDIGTVMNPGIRVAGLPVACSLLCLFAGCSRQAPVRAEEARPVKTLVIAAPGATYSRIFPGKVEASRSAELSFQVPGVVTALPVKEGQRIAKGQVIARLRQDEFQARRKVAQGQLEQAQATLDALRLGERPEEQLRREAGLRAAEAKLANAKTEFDRYTRLLPSGSVSRAEYELSQTAYDVAQEERKAAIQLVEKGTSSRKEDIEAQEAQVRTLQGRLAEADIQLNDCILRAPYAGVIGRRLIEEGQVVAPNKPAFQFQNVGQIDVVADVPEAAMAAGFGPANVVGIAAGFSNAPGVQFPVRVKEIAQVADPVTQTFAVRFTMPAPRRPSVLPGMTATIDVTYRQAGGAGNRILVPVSAVVNETGQQIVWILGKDQTIRYRTVRIGSVKGGQVEILSGLRPGDRVAVAGAPFLREGMKVRDLGNALGGSQP
jgi:membrane fusion protein, multidrug efflux system